MVLIIMIYENKNNGNCNYSNKIKHNNSYINQINNSSNDEIK